MNKNSVRGYLTLAIVFAVLCVVSFVAPFPKTSVFWVGYIFAVIAIAFQIYVFKISFSGADSVKSKFYGFPIAMVGMTYLFAQLIASIIEMILAAILPVWVAVIVNILLLGFVLVGCIATEAMRDEIIRQDVVLKKDVSNMRNLQSMSASLVGLCQDADLKKELQALADDFKYSDPVSSEQTLTLEADLDTQMNEIQKSLIDGDFESVKALCNRILGCLAERNRVCRLGK